MDMVAQIKSEIEQKMAELQELQTALEVVVRLSGKPKAGGKAEAASQPLFTVRKKQGVLGPVVAKAGRPIKYVNWRETVQNVIAASDQPLKAGDIVKALGLSGKDQHRVYGVLNYLKDTRGVIHRSDDGSYSMVARDLGVVDESPDADKSPQAGQSAEAA